MSIAPLIPEATLRTMRAVQEANMPHTCVIKALTRGPRVGGVASETWNPVATVKCRVTIAGAALEILSADQLRNASRYEVSLPLSVTQVTRDHRLEVSGELDGVAWSMLLTVEGPLGPKLAQTARRYLCSVVAGVGA